MLTGSLWECIMFTFQKYIYTCLIMRSHVTRLENVPTFFELVRILNHSLTGVTEANS